MEFQIFYAYIYKIRIKLMIPLCNLLFSFNNLAHIWWSEKSKLLICVQSLTPFV